VRSAAQTRAGACERARARSRCRLLACNMCNIMYAMPRPPPPLGYSPPLEPAYANPLNKLARAASGEDIRPRRKRKSVSARRGMKRLRNPSVRLQPDAALAADKPWQ
jgi:hypothetical protein